MKKCEERRNLSFLSWSLVKRKEKRRDEKLFCLIEKKNEKIENKISKILLLCPY